MWSITFFSMLVSLVLTGYLAKTRGRSLIFWTLLALISFFGIPKVLVDVAGIVGLFSVPFLLVIAPRAGRSVVLDRSLVVVAVSACALITYGGVRQRARVKKILSAVEMNGHRIRQDVARSELSNWGLFNSNDGTHLSLDGYVFKLTRAGKTWTAAITSERLINGKKDVYVVNSEGQECALFDAIESKLDANCASPPKEKQLRDPNFVFVPRLVR